MARTVTVTFRDGSSHVYQGVPDDATPAQVQERAGRDFPSLSLVHIDGGAGAIPGQEGEGARRALAAANRKEPGMLDKAIGTGEALLTAVTGIPGGILGMAGGGLGAAAGAIATGQFGTKQAADQIEQAAAEGAAGLTYAPRTQSGQDQAEVVGRAMQQLIPIMGAAPGISNPAGGLAVARNALRGRLPR